MAISKQVSSSKSVVFSKQRSYSEVIEFLDSHWTKTHTEKNLATIIALDKALGNPSKKTKAILIGGTNGKGLTIHFAIKLFLEEKISVGALYSPHILTYNERFALNNEIIGNKAFAELANEVLNVAESNGINATSSEILTAMALVYFEKNNVDVVLLEMFENSPLDPTNIVHPTIHAITRITDEKMVPQSTETIESIKRMVEGIGKGTYVISGDQSKLNLQVICTQIEKKGAIWSMPIRKLSPLNYPFEQLHGRCAALAERICQIFINNFMDKDAPMLNNSLLAKQKGQRGRPTLEAKRQSELNPKKTLEQFWKEQQNTLPGRFQLLDKEKPSILLDNASNIDALKNLFLGIRLLHYQRPLKGLSFIFGCDKNSMNTEEFPRLLRYFCKKNSAQVIFCPIEANVPGISEQSWDVEEITNKVKGIKINAKATKSFEEAFEMAKKTIAKVDERNGLIVISGSKSIITQYWLHKGMKKLL